jgi:hypothetical protein
MSYEKWTDEELRKEQKRLWVNMVKNELCIIALFGLALLLYLAAKNGMWWLLCGGAGLVAFLFFIYSLCAAAARADDIQGTR